MLEHPRPWSRKCIDSLKGKLSDRVHALIDDREDARPQLIHRPSECPDPPRVMLARVDRAASKLWDVPYTALLDPRYASLDSLIEAGTLRSEPVYLVCVHGRRDLCCATFGVAFYGALGDEVGARVFQTSHIGGHRFAATAVVYPQAFYYGRLEPADAPALAQAHEAGRVGPTAKLRGRAGPEPLLQAAEVFAMRHLGPSAPQEVELSRTDDSHFQLITPKGERSFSVSRQPLSEDSPKGCADEPARLFALTEIPAP